MSSFRSLSRLCAPILTAILTILYGLVLGGLPAAAQTGAQTGTQPGIQTRIQNTATLSFDDAGSDSGSRSVPSNTVTLDVNRAKRPTTLTFHLPPPHAGRIVLIDSAKPDQAPIAIADSYDLPAQGAALLTWTMQP